MLILCGIPPHLFSMYMKDWLETIDDYLKMTRRDILTSSGHISHKQAIEKAHAEYDNRVGGR